LDLPLALVLYEVLNQRSFVPSWLLAPGLVEPAKILMAQAPAPEQGFLSSYSGSGAGHFPFMALTPAPFDLNFAGSALN